MTAATISQPGTTGAAAPDLTTTAGKLADLRARIAETHTPMGQASVDRVHDAGKKTARERIEYLLDDGSFVEVDALARHRSKNFGLDAKRPITDGVVTGYGTIDGRKVCVFSQDGAIFGGALGEVYGEKIVKIMDLAIKTGVPLIGINEGAGARIQEGVVSLGLYAQIFYRNTLASGVIPQISLIMGACAGGHVYSPALTDFIIMVDKTSKMFITGPDVIKTVTGEIVTQEELGGAHTHMGTSGTSHYTASDDADALDWVRDLVGYLPANNRAEAPREPADIMVGSVQENITDSDLELDTIIPDSPNQPYDMKDIITHVLMMATSSKSKKATPAISSLALAGSKADPWAWWPTNPPNLLAVWIFERQRKPHDLSAPVMPSTFPSSSLSMCPASSPAPARNTTASFAVGRNCCMLTRKPPSARLLLLPVSPTVALIA